MAFDLASARPVEPQPAAREGGGFDTATARPAGPGAPTAPAAGLAPPMRAEIPVDPNLVAPPGAQPQTTPQQDRAAAIMAKENPIAEKVLGAVEGALDIVAKLGGGLIGGLGGAYTAPLRGQSMDAGFAEGGAAGVDVARQGLGLLRLGSGAGPRTETGQAITDGADQVLQQLPAAGGVYGTLAGPAMNARAAARQVAAPVVQATRQGLDTATAAVQRGTGLAQSVRPTQAAVAAPSPTAGTQGSAGAAGADIATVRRERARSLPVPFEGDAALTEGQATRSFEAQRFERETAKDPDMGQKLRERAAEQNAVALRNLDALEEFTGATKADRGASGQAVVDAIAGKAQRAKGEINRAYDEARAAGDMAEPVDATPLAQWIEDNRSSAGNAGVIGTAEAELLRLGGAQKAGDGSLVPREITINDLEELRKKIVAGGKKDPTNAHFAGQINAAIDAMTEGRGGALYKAARVKFRDYQAEFKERGAIRDIIGIKKGTSDRITATEKVLERAMRSSDDLRNVRETLITAGDDGVQAWREVQGQAMRKLRDEVTRGVANDIRGNPIVSPAKLKQTIDSWDQGGQLEVLFGKKGAETLRDLRDVGQDLFTAPPGAVNTSNTASVIAKWMADSAASFVATGIPAPLIGLTKAAWKVRSDRQVKKQVEKALGPAEPPAPRTQPPRNPLEGSDSLPTAAPRPPAPKPAGAAPVAAPRETSPDPRLRDIEALREGATPEVARVLDAEAKRVRAEAAAKTSAAAREREVEALERAAAAATNASVRRALQARADALRAEKIPTGEARELDGIPAAAGERTGRVPAGDATELTPEQLAQAKPTKRERELLALREQATDAEVIKDLDKTIAAERKRAAEERRGEEYLRLADRATDPELRASFEAKAKKLGAVRRNEPVPQPEVTELAVEAVDPAPALLDPVRLPEAEIAQWASEWNFGKLDARAAQDVRDARRYDSAAVDRAQQQHERQPDLFRRAIQRIIEEGKARESQAEPPAGGSEGPRGPRGGLQGEGPGEQSGPGSSAPVTPGGGRPRAPDGPAGGGSQARADQGVEPPAAGPGSARFQDLARRVGKIDDQKGLTEAERGIERRFADAVRADPDGFLQRYEQLPDTRGGKVVNTDEARELWDEYSRDNEARALNARAVHEPASWIAKAQWDRLISEPPKSGKVMLLGGGGGSGKTSSLDGIEPGFDQRFDAIYDTTLASEPKAIKVIEQALESGRTVEVTFTARDPLDSIVNGIIKRAKVRGRTVPLEVAAEAHVMAPKVLQKLRERFLDDDRVSFRFVDNTGGPGQQRIVQPRDLPQFDYNDLVGRALRAARQAYEEGSISEPVFRGLAGEAGREGRAGLPGGAGRSVGADADREPAPQYPQGSERGTGGQGRQEVAAVASAPAGRLATASTDRGGQIQTRYRLMEAGDLITSHDNSLRPNPGYDQTLQPRDRARQASEDQIARLANDIRPELLGDSPKASEGSPIIGADAQVESGNARTIALRRAYESGKAKHYRLWLMDHAEEFGLTAAQVRKLKQPVLVRQGLGDYDRAQFARDANESSVAEVSSTERARSDARTLPDLEGLQFDEAGNVDVGASVDWIRSYVQTTVGPSKRGEIMTATGELSQTGNTRIRNAVLMKAYNDPALVERVSESLDPGTKNVLNGLSRAAPDVAKLQDMAADGAREAPAWVPDLVEAVRRFSDAREAGQTVKEYLGQGSLLGGEATPEVAGWMQQIEAFNRAPRRLADHIRALARESMKDPRQGELMEPRAAYGKPAKLADDLAAQQQFLVQRASEAGFGSLDEFVAGDFEGFMRAADEWRQRNPATELREPDLLTTQTPADLKAKAEREAAALKADQAEQKRLADKARADAMRDEFTLTGSDRAADNANQGSLFEPKPLPATSPYETDLFGAPVVPPAKRAGSRRGGLQPPTAAGRNVDAAAGLSGAPPGQYATRAALVATRQQELGHAGPIKSLADAAHALAYLNKSAVERFDALVTDKNGNPLAVIGGFKGALSQASVYPATLLGEAMQVPGAANLWMSHNHPSGVTALSRADEMLASNIAVAFDGTGIKVRGIIAAGSDKWGGAAPSHDGGMVFDVHTSERPLKPTRGASVPAQERQLVESGKLGPAVESPASAKEIVRRLVQANAYRPTIILLDSQHQPVAAVPWSVDDAMPLKGNGKLDRLLRAVATSNAGAALIGTGDSKSGARVLSMEQAQNIGAALAKAEVRVLDIIDANGGSAAEKGLSTRAAVLRSVGAAGAVLGLGAVAQNQDEADDGS